MRARPGRPDQAEASLPITGSVRNHECTAQTPDQIVMPCAHPVPRDGLVRVFSDDTLGRGSCLQE